MNNTLTPLKDHVTFGGGNPFPVTQDTLMLSPREYVCLVPDISGAWRGGEYKNIGWLASPESKYNHKTPLFTPPRHNLYNKITKENKQ